MSGTGAGRGRGWLNLNNKNEATRPGATPPAIIQAEVAVAEAKPPPTPEENPIVTKGIALIALIQHLSADDDGILLNKKLSNIVKTWKKICEDQEEIKNVAYIVYTKCREDPALASKFTIMLASQSFAREVIHDFQIRSIFIVYMQQDFENAKELQATNPVAFRVSIQILGDFYHKRRQDKGSYKILALPLLQYMEMLLASAQEAEYEVFTTQLYLNGAAIKANWYEKVQELLMKVRQTLVTKVDLSQKCKVWLLLALDAESTLFSLFAPELRKFYTEHLGEATIANFQGAYSTRSLSRLTIQTAYVNKSLEGYQSNVNVLQVTPPDPAPPPVPTTDPIQIADTYNHCGGVQGVAADTWAEQTAPQPSVPPPPPREKGRPILGVGARLQRNHYDAVRQGPSQGMDDATGWDNKYKSQDATQWTDEHQPAVKSAAAYEKTYKKAAKMIKGWEHDDRFENDYSAT